MLDTLSLGLAIGIAVAIFLIFVKSARMIVLPLLLFFGVASLSLIINLREEHRKDREAEARYTNAADRQPERGRSYVSPSASNPASDTSTVVADGLQPQPQPLRPSFVPQPLPARGAAAGVNANQTSYVNSGLR